MFTTRFCRDSIALSNLEKLKEAFLEHCKLWGHFQISSYSVKSESSELLFTNSGMAPLIAAFKSGDINIRSPLCGIQRCIRLGGKHNDYINIGLSKRHLSFFEMMGAFSFGSYGRRYAIEMV